MYRKHVVVAALAVSLGAAIFFVTQIQRDARRTPHGFVTRVGARLVVDDQPFRFVGANVAVVYGRTEREQMPQTFAHAAADGIRVVRVWAFGETDEAEGGPRKANTEWLYDNPYRRGPDDWNEEAFRYLDRLLVEAEKNRLRVQICLANWWRDTGGVTQYLAWAGIKDAADENQPYGINVEKAMLFYSHQETRRLYREHVRRIITRRNSINGRLYKDDPTIFGYELINEAQAPTGRWAERRAWVAEMSAYIKSLDPNHMVVPGTWGYRNALERRAWIEEHSIQTIDYCQVHHYPEEDLDSFVDSRQSLKEFVENRAAAALFIGKPLVIGEFGITREGFNGFSRLEWFRALFDAAQQASLAGVFYWILTHDIERAYGVTYTDGRDHDLWAETRRAAEMFAARRYARSPSTDFGQHLIPRQFAFERPASDPASLPKVTAEPGLLTYRFKPENATRARFEKLGSDKGYVWGTGVGFIEYIVPARQDWRRVGKIIIRAYLKPVIPHDSVGRVRSTRVHLYINDKDFGSRIVLEQEEPVIQEWIVDSYLARLKAMRGGPLAIRFVVRADSDLPFGLNISTWPDGFEAGERAPVEVELRK